MAEKRSYGASEPVLASPLPCTPPRAENGSCGALCAVPAPADAFAASPATGESTPEAGGVPCHLFSRISIRESTPKGEKHRVLSANNRRSAHILAESVSLAARLYGIERLGFLTLTFADHVTCPDEAQRRLNSLISNVIKQRYRDYVGVLERQKSGRIHYHLLVALDHDIRTGFDFDSAAAADRDYSSASKYLRCEWSFWRKTATKFGFGRTELKPVKSSTEAISRYVGKYISKHISQRKEEDKGVRLVRYSNGVRAGTTRFQFVNSGSAQWRQKLALFAEIMSVTLGKTLSSIDDLSEELGPRWAYKHREFIIGLPVENSAGIVDRVRFLADRRIEDEGLLS